MISSPALVTGVVLNYHNVVIGSGIVPTVQMKPGAVSTKYSNTYFIHDGKYV